MPWSLFFHAINAGTTAFDIAEVFDVTEELVEYRIKITGATDLYRNRSSRLGTQRRQPISLVSLPTRSSALGAGWDDNGNRDSEICKILTEYFQ